jgi:hypothetical protein
MRGMTQKTKEYGRAAGFMDNEHYKVFLSQPISKFHFCIHILSHDV